MPPLGTTPLPALLGLPAPLRRSPLRRALPLLAAALLAASCSTAGQGADDDSKGAATSPSPPSPSSPPSKPSPTPLRADDGHDVTACRDARCEIVLRGPADIPLRPRFGCTLFHLGYEKPDTVTFDVRRPEYGDARGHIGGTGYLSLANGVTVTVTRIDSRGAVLRFEPKAKSRTDDQASGSHGLSLTGG